MGVSRLVLYMHLLNDLLISLNKANVLVKQSAETVHHCKCWGGRWREGEERKGWGERESERREEQNGVRWMLVSGDVSGP